MSNLDFLVFTLILLFIAFYGVYKNYQNKNLKSYILGDRSLSWSTIGLSVMATQASAITFISTPGQGYAEGMSFIQNYFGMPLALIVVSIFFIPRYYGSKVFTAYQYLEKRFDLKVRTLTSFFLTDTLVNINISLNSYDILEIAKFLFDRFFFELSLYLLKNNCKFPNLI